MGRTDAPFYQHFQVFGIHSVELYYTTNYTTMVLNHCLKTKKSTFVMMGSGVRVPSAAPTIDILPIKISNLIKLRDPLSTSQSTFWSLLDTIPAVRQTSEYCDSCNRLGKETSCLSTLSRLGLCRTGQGSARKPPERCFGE